MAKSVGSGGVFVSDSKTVTSAGTSEALAATNFLLWNALTIVAKDNNTGRVYVGGLISSTVASTTNRGMGPGDTLILRPSRGHSIDLSAVYLDVSVSGEGVDYYATA
mgnify:FL=1